MSWPVIDIRVNKGSRLLLHARAFISTHFPKGSSCPRTKLLSCIPNFRYLMRATLREKRKTHAITTRPSFLPSFLSFQISSWSFELNILFKLWRIYYEIIVSICFFFLKKYLINFSWELLVNIFLVNSINKSFLPQ